MTIKKFVFFFFILITACGTKSPNNLKVIGGCLIDNEKIFSKDQRTELIRAIDMLFKKTNIKLRIVTLKQIHYFSNNHKEWESFGVRLNERFGDNPLVDKYVVFCISRKEQIYYISTSKKFQEKMSMYVINEMMYDSLTIFRSKDKEEHLAILDTILKLANDPRFSDSI